MDNNVYYSFKNKVFLDNHTNNVKLIEFILKNVLVGNPIKDQHPAKLQMNLKYYKKNKL